MKLTKEQQIEMLRQMLRIRYFEEKVEELFKMNEIKGTTHLYIGEEATAVGACSAIRENDYITSTHRGHGHCIAKGGKVKYMMAELFGKKTGYCKGKGGSLHIADVESGNLGANGIVGGGIPLAVGAGLSISYKGEDKVVLCFFGDGAVNQGVFHESVNLAAVWNLPIVFICENNLYGMSTPFGEVSRMKDVAKRAEAYGIPGIIADGNDVLDVYSKVSGAVKKAREGKGPVLVECKTYRWRGHSKSDPRVYRTREEEKEWREKCPIKRFKRYLVTAEIASEGELDKVDRELADEIEEAVEYARASSYPELKEALMDVYAE